MRILNYTQDSKKNIDIILVKYPKWSTERIFESLNEFQASIEKITRLTEGEKYREEVKELYFLTLVSCEKLIKEEHPKEKIGKVRNREDYVLIKCATGSNHFPSVNTLFASPEKLAALIIPKFTGTYAECSTFNDIFTVLVLNNKILSEFQKFFYLRSLLGD